MFRAVKVVRREDFEFERTFEREFEGIQKYEQVSQDHQGLVDVLHVGRDDDAGFYYYVMELADDEDGFGDEIDVVEYKARTLSSDLRKNPGRSVHECVRLGISLAGALGHLHQAGLTHRDVKPSNIIFVKGKPKLADVGLVAATGQRTYVGTEGYVPPEGPGTSSADLYSLAMVLYEMHTGKDRLDFPELPTNLEIPPTVNRDEWRSLNTVICRAGSPDPRKRFETAHSFAKALRGVVGDQSPGAGGKKSSPAKGFFVFVLLMLLLGGIGYGGYWLWNDNQSFLDENGGLLAENGANDSGGPDIEEIVVADPTSQPEISGDGDFNLIELPEKDPEDDDGGLILNDPKSGKETEMVKETVEDSNPVKAEPVKQGEVKFESQPGGATVYVDGEEVGLTETRLINFEVGTIDVVLKKDGYHDWEQEWKVKEGFQMIRATLTRDQTPRANEPWRNSRGMTFVPRGDSGKFISDDPISVELFDQFGEETGLAIPRTAVDGVVHVPDPEGRQAFCDWLTEMDRFTGFLDEGYYYRPMTPTSELDNSFNCLLENEFGVLILNSEPVGAQVFLKGVHIGETPMTYERVQRGVSSVELFLPGYEVMPLSVVIDQVDEPYSNTVPLVRDASVIYGEKWTNSQGMTLLPVGGVMVAAFETRIRDFREFMAGQGNGLPAIPVLSDVLDHPVAGVSLAEANEFCEWLTIKERTLNLIRPWQSYRVPTDEEWSRFVGLEGEEGTTPQERNRLVANIFPWGAEWPPPARSGNFADESAVAYFRNHVIEGYEDGFDRTAPVGSFAPSKDGLFDLSGNVWEWVQDSYDGSANAYHVTRGGGWNAYDKSMLRSGYRNVVPAEAQEGFYGFRYVLEDTGSPD